MGPQEDYIEAVVTCEGDFHDPQLQDRLWHFQQKLESLLLKDDKKQLVLKKVEPWNSVRVTFNIPKQAALRLKQLAEQRNPILRQIGVLGVQIQGDRLVSLTVATPNNQRAEVIISTQDGAGQSGSTEPSAPVAGSSANVQVPSSSEEHSSPGASMEVTRKNIEEYLKQGSLFKSMLTPSTSGPSPVPSLNTCQSLASSFKVSLHRNSGAGTEAHDGIGLMSFKSRFAVGAKSQLPEGLPSFVSEAKGLLSELDSRRGPAGLVSTQQHHQHALQHRLQHPPDPSHTQLPLQTSLQQRPEQHPRSSFVQHFPQQFNNEHRPLQHSPQQDFKPIPPMQPYPSQQHSVQQHNHLSQQHPAQLASTHHLLQHPSEQHPSQQHPHSNMAQHSLSQQMLTHSIGNQEPSQGTALPQTAAIGDNLNSLPPPPPYPHKNTASKANNTHRKTKKSTDSSPMLIGLLKTEAAAGVNTFPSGPDSMDKPKKKGSRRRRKDKQSLSGLVEDGAPNIAMDSTRLPNVGLQAQPAASQHVSTVPLSSPVTNKNRISEGFRDMHTSPSSSDLTSFAQNRIISKEREQFSNEAIINPITGFMEPRDGTSDLSPTGKQQAHENSSADELKVKVETLYSTATGRYHTITSRPNSVLERRALHLSSAVPGSFREKQQFPGVPVYSPSETTFVNKDGSLMENSLAPYAKVDVVNAPVSVGMQTATNSSQYSALTASVGSGPGSHSVRTNSATTVNDPKVSLPGSYSVSSVVSQTFEQASNFHHKGPNSQNVNGSLDGKMGISLHLDSRKRRLDDVDSNHLDSKPLTKKAKSDVDIHHRVHCTTSASPLSHNESPAVLSSSSNIPTATQRISADFVLNSSTSSPVGSRLLSDGDENSNHSPVSQTDGLVGPSALLDANGGKTEHHDSGVGSLSERSDDTTPSDVGDGEFPLNTQTCESLTSTSGKPGAGMKKIAFNYEKLAQNKETSVMVGCVQTNPFNPGLLGKDNLKQKLDEASPMINDKGIVHDTLTYADKMTIGPVQPALQVAPANQKELSSPRPASSPLHPQLHLANTVAVSANQTLGVSRGNPTPPMESVPMQLPRSLQLPNAAASIRHPIGITISHNQGHTNVLHPQDSLHPSLPGHLRMMGPQTSLGNNQPLHFPTSTPGRFRLHHPQTTPLNRLGLPRLSPHANYGQRLDHPVSKAGLQFPITSVPATREGGHSPSGVSEGQLLHQGVMTERRLSPLIVNNQKLCPSTLPVTNAQQLNHSGNPGMPNTDLITVGMSQNPGLHHPPMPPHSSPGPHRPLTVINPRLQRPLTPGPGNQRLYVPASASSNNPGLLHRPRSVPNNYGLPLPSPMVHHNQGLPHRLLHRQQVPDRTVPSGLAGIAGLRLSQSLPNSLGFQSGPHSAGLSSQAPGKPANHASSQSPQLALLRAQGFDAPPSVLDANMVPSSNIRPPINSASPSLYPAMISSGSGGSLVRPYGLQTSLEDGKSVGVNATNVPIGLDSKMSGPPFVHGNLTNGGVLLNPSLGPGPTRLQSASLALQTLPSIFRDSALKMDGTNGPHTTGSDSVKLLHPNEQTVVASLLPDGAKLDIQNHPMLKDIRSQGNSTTVYSQQRVVPVAYSASLPHSSAVNMQLKDTEEKAHSLIPPHSAEDLVSPDGKLTPLEVSTDDSSCLAANLPSGSLPDELDLGILDSELTEFEGLLDAEQDLADLMESDGLHLELHPENSSACVNTDNCGGSNITSMYSKRSSPVNMNMLNHVYAAGLPQPRCLTESVQRLVKPLPNPENSQYQGHTRKSPVPCSNSNGSPCAVTCAAVTSSESASVVTSQSLSADRSSVSSSSAEDKPDLDAKAGDKAGTLPNGVSPHLVHSGAGPTKEVSVAVQPTPPSVQPSSPSVRPSSPSVQPSSPSVRPSSPSVQPTPPSVQPSSPFVPPSSPSVQPTPPSVQPSSPSVHPSSPVQPTLPVQPTSPSVQPSSPSVQPTPPSVQATPPSVQATPPVHPTSPPASSDQDSVPTSQAEPSALLSSQQSKVTTRLHSSTPPASASSKPTTGDAYFDTPVLSGRTRSQGGRGPQEKAASSTAEESPAAPTSNVTATQPAVTAKIKEGAVATPGPKRSMRSLKTKNTVADSNPGKRKRNKEQR